MAEANWIDLAGAVNVRDVGGMATADGTVRRGRLIRADNLQQLTPQDVRVLVDDIGVRAVADLRSSPEVASEGPGPLTEHPSVSIHHLSLVPELGLRTDAGALERDGLGRLIMPWHGRDAGDRKRPPAWRIYLDYLAHRPDSVLGALRLIAHADGATIVHCAAGKDRTGAVVALALADVGVGHEDIVADYLRTAERIDAIFARLAASPTYGADLLGSSSGPHRIGPEAIQGFLAGLTEEYGSPSAALRAFGWTDDDHHALHAALVAPGP